MKSATKTKYYAMKDIEKLLGMTVYTIRHYTDNGLVPDIKRDKNNNRIFDEEALNWLKAAQFMRGCGMSVKKVRAYFALCRQGPVTIPQRIKIMQEVARDNQPKIADLEKKQAIIHERLTHYQDILHKKTPDDSNPQTWNPSTYC